MAFLTLMQNINLYKNQTSVSNATWSLISFWSSLSLPNYLESIYIKTQFSHVCWSSNWKINPMCFCPSLAYREEGCWTTAILSSSSSFCSPSLWPPSCSASSSASSSTMPTLQPPAAALFTSPFTSRTSSALPGRSTWPRTWRSWW